MNGLLKPGDMLLEYRILKVIGEGGMGIVFKAIHEDYDDIVAIKILAPRYATREDFAARFKQECRIYPKLKHPNIVRMRRAGIATLPTPQSSAEPPPPIAFVVMDLLEGKTLRRILDKYHRLDFLNTLHVMIQIADAMRAAHAKGIVHRDLKPENIMVGAEGDEKGFVWVMDFGIAMAGEGSMNTADMPDVGTARYMSPEQVQSIFSVARKGDRVKLDRRVDIYAFGVIFYEVITGVHIFIDDNDPPTFQQMLAGHLVAEPTPVHQLVADCPDVAWSIISRCIAINPKDRYQSFDEVLTDLRAIIRESVPPLHPLAKRVVAERERVASRAAFASLPEPPKAAGQASTVSSDRAALPPEQPAPVEEPTPERDATPPPSPVDTEPALPPETEAPSGEVEAPASGFAPTIEMHSETGTGASADAARATAEFVAYVRRKTLPFVAPAAAPFVPPAQLLQVERGVRGTVKMSRPEIPPTGSSPSASAHRSPPAAPAVPAAAPLLNPAPPAATAFAMAAQPPMRWGAVASTPSTPRADVSFVSRTWASPAAPPPSASNAVAPVQPQGFRLPPIDPPPQWLRPQAMPTRGSALSTPSTMISFSRLSRRHLILAPLIGLAIVVFGSAGLIIAARPRGSSLGAATSPTAPSAPLPAPEASAGAPPAASEAAPSATAPTAPPSTATAVPPGSATSAPSARAPATSRPVKPAPRSPARTPVIPLVME